MEVAGGIRRPKHGPAKQGEREECGTLYYFILVD